MTRSLLMLCLSTAAHAGTTVVFERQRGDDPPGKVVLQCEGTSARFEGSAAKGNVVIWDPAAKAIDVLQPEKHAYVQLTQAQLTAMREQAKAKLAQMRERLADLPPERRAQVEAMANALSGAETPADWKFTALGTKQKVGAFSCELYDAQRGGQKMQFCLAPWASAPAKKDDLECFKSVGEIMRGMLGTVAREGDSLHEDWMKYPGFPVQVSHTLPDGKKVVNTLKSVERAKLGADAFKVPADYKLTTLQELR